MKSLKALAWFSLALSATALLGAVDETAFSRKVEFTFGGYAGATTLANFPALIRLSESAIANFDYDDCASASIRFTDGAGNLVPHEIDTWNAAGTSLVWVSVPALAGTSTKLTMYYGGAGAAYEFAPGNAWTNAGYTAVWHLGEASGSCADSTGNGLTAVPSGAQSADSVAYAGAPIGAGRQFATATANKTYLLVANAGKLDMGNVFTVSGWFKAASTAATRSARYCSRKNNYKDTNGFEIEQRYDANATIPATVISSRGANQGDHTQTVPNITQNWLHLMVCYNGTTLQYYVNGTKGNTLTLNSAASDNDLAFAIGNNPTGGEANWVGWMDEFRLYDGAMSDDRAAAEYANMTSASFATASEAMPVDPSMPEFSGSPTLVCNADNASFDFSATLSAGSGDLFAVYNDLSAGTSVTNTIATDASELRAYTDHFASPQLVSGHVYSWGVFVHSTGGNDRYYPGEGVVFAGDVTVVKTSDADEAAGTPGVFTFARPDTAAAKVADLKVAYTIGGTALPGQTYQALSGTVTIPAGQASATVSVTPVYNAAVDEDVTVVVSVAAAGTCFIPAADGSATLVIDNSEYNPFVRYVTTTGSDTNDGYTLSSAKGTIAAAVAAFAGLAADKIGTVYVAAGVYAETAAVATSGNTALSCVTITNAVQVIGMTGNAADVVVTRSSQNARIFYLNHPAALIRHLTVKNGYARATVANNPEEGSNVYIASLGGSVIDCAITGGGSSAWNSYGNGIFMKAGYVARCAVTNITVGCANGHLYATSGLIEDTLIARNTTGSGYAARLDGAATLLNCTIARNTGTSGAGVNANNTASRVVNCAIFENTAPASVNGRVWGGKAASFVNCAADLEIAGSTACLVGDPLFRNSANGDFRLTPGSCCYDAGGGTSAYSPVSATDLDGKPRVVGTIDIGCYEHQKSGLDVSFTCSLDRKTTPATATFAASVVGASGSVTYDWSFGNGATAQRVDVPDVVNVYAVGGTYTVSLTVTSGGSSATYTRTNLVKVSPPVLYVLHANASAAEPYDTESIAAPNMATAVAFAAEGATIIVLPGLDGMLYQDAQVTVDKGIRIVGATGRPGDVVLRNTRTSDGGRLFILNHPDAFVANLTLQDGFMSANTSSGAGVNFMANGGTVSNCVIRNARTVHFSSQGAAVYMENGLLTHTEITGTFQSHPAYNAPNYDNLPVVVQINGTNARMENCLVHDIVFRKDGGSDFSSIGPVVGMSQGKIANCTVVNAALPLYTGKTTYGGGAGIYASGGTVINCAVAGITRASTNYVDGICVTNRFNAPFYGTATRFANCAGDSGAAWGGTACIDGTGAAFFRDFGGGDYRISGGGPLRNAGAPVTLASSTDFVGNPRVVDRSIDIGCYEALPMASCIILR